MGDNSRDMVGICKQFPSNRFCLQALRHFGVDVIAQRHQSTRNMDNNDTETADVMRFISLACAEVLP